MTYSDAIKKAAAWWDPTSWGSSDKPKEQPKQEESYGFDFKTTPINEYRPSKPTYTSALDRAKAINSNVARANAAGQADRQKELQQRTTMRTMLDSMLGQVAGDMQEKQAQARAVRNENLTRQQVQQQMERERYEAAAGAPTVAQHDAQLRQQQASNPYGSFASASTMSYKPGVSNRQPTAVPSWRREQQQVAAMMNKQPAVTQGQTTYRQPTYASAYQNRNSFANNSRQYGNAYFRPTFQNRLTSR